MKYTKGKYYTGKGVYLEMRTTYYPIFRDIRTPDSTSSQVAEQHHVFSTGKYDSSGAVGLYKELIH